MSGWTSPVISYLLYDLHYKPLDRQIRFIRFILSLIFFRIQLSWEEKIVTYETFSSWFVLTRRIFFPLLLSFSHSGWIYCWQYCDKKSLNGAKVFRGSCWNFCSKILPQFFWWWATLVAQVTECLASYPGGCELKELFGWIIRNNVMRKNSARF